MFNEHHLRAEFDYRTEVLQRTSSTRRVLSDPPTVIKPSSRSQRLVSMPQRLLRRMWVQSAKTPMAVDSRSEVAS